MNEFQLLDEQDNRIYFVFAPNHPQSLSLFEQHLETILSRVSSIASNGEPYLWILKRIAIIGEDKISYFPDNELLIEPDVFMETSIHLDYIILLFIRHSPASPFEIQPIPTIEGHTNFEDAQKEALEKITSLKSLSPHIEIKALGAKMIYNIPLK